MRQTGASAGSMAVAVALYGLWLSGARERTLVAAVLEMAAIYRSLALSIPALRTVALRRDNFAAL